MCFDCLTDATNAFVNRQILHSGTLPGAPPPVSCCLSQVMSAVPDQAVAVEIDDDRKLEELGYVPSFKREFSNLATVRCRFSRAFPRPHLTKPVHRLALRSASWYFLRPEPKKISRSSGRVPGCLLQCLDDVQYALVTRGSIFGLSGYVMAVIATHAHAVIRFSPIEQVTWCWLLGATMCFTLGTPLPLLHARLETNAPASHRLEHSRNRQRFPDLWWPLHRVCPTLPAKTLPDSRLGRWMAEHPRSSWGRFFY